MDRRKFILNGLLAGAALEVRHAHSAPLGAEAPVRLKVHADQPLTTIAPSFQGLGFEISSVSRPGLLQRANRVYVQLVRTLGARGVIRIGGNTSDYARYAADEAPVSSAYATVVNDAVLADLGGFLEATGWQLIWGLDLGRGSQAEAIAQISAVLPNAAERLLAFEIGNEPDLFGRAGHRKPEYSYDDWLAEYRRYKGVLRARFPGVPLAGPDVARDTEWVTRFAADEGADLVLLTHHYYREGQNPTSTIEKLLQPDPKLQPELTALSAAAKSSGVPYRFCEVNSFSGGGRPGVSDTMAGALWVLDYMFTLAANGCSGVNMETGVNHLDFISSYSPIGDDEQGHYAARAEYYGMLAFALSGRGTLLASQIEPASTAIRAYATAPDKDSLAVTLINKTASTAVVDVNIDALPHAREARITRLSAPAVDAKSGITLGGAQIAADGTWTPTDIATVRIADATHQVLLPAYSAAIVTIAHSVAHSGGWSRGHSGGS